MKKNEGRKSRASVPLRHHQGTHKVPQYITRVLILQHSTGVPIPQHTTRVLMQYLNTPPGYAYLNTVAHTDRIPYTVQYVPIIDLYVPLDTIYCCREAPGIKPPLSVGHSGKHFTQATD